MGEGARNLPISYFFCLTMVMKEKCVYLGMWFEGDQDQCGGKQEHEGTPNPQERNMNAGALSGSPAYGVVRLTLRGGLSPLLNLSGNASQTH